MTLDYIVAGLPPLVFGEPSPLGEDEFFARCGSYAARVRAALDGGVWRDVIVQFRNAIARARGGEDDVRRAEGCDVALAERTAACFAEKDPLARQRLLDKTLWDAAERLADPASPLGFGALAAYAARLRIAISRDRISKEDGAAAFARLLDSAAADAHHTEGRDKA